MSKNLSKILILSSEFPPLPGGIGNHAYNLAQMLTAAGVKVQVLTDCRSKNIEAEKAFDQALPFRVMRILRRRPVLLTYWRRILETYRLLRTKEAQTVLASGKFSLWLAAVGSLLFPQHRYLAVIHGSEVNPAGMIPRWFTHWSLRQFEQLIAVSHFTRHLIWKIHAQLPVRVINNGYSPSSAITISSKKLKGYPALITVGNVSYRKGQQNVIKALPLLRQTYPDIHYHIVGIPTEEAAFTQLAAELGVASHLSFHGVVDVETLPTLLAGADIFMMLSQELKNGDVEGFGIAILEANALGIPAIGTLNSGIADAIKEGYSGKLIDPQAPEAICAAMATILENYPAYSNHAREWAQHFTWEKIVGQYLEVLNIQIPTAETALS